MLVRQKIGREEVEVQGNAQQIEEFLKNWTEAVQARMTDAAPEIVRLQNQLNEVSAAHNRMCERIRQVEPMLGIKGMKAADILDMLIARLAGATDYRYRPLPSHDPGNNNCPRNADPRNESCICGVPGA